MPHLLLIVSKSDYLIWIVHINSHSEWQTVQIQISWLLQKPTDLDLHCFQKPTDLELHCLQRQGISGFSRTRVKFFCIWKPLIRLNDFAVWSGSLQLEHGLKILFQMARLKYTDIAKWKDLSEIMWTVMTQICLQIHMLIWTLVFAYKFYHSFRFKFVCLTIFQSYLSSVWMWQGAHYSILECCLPEISCPKHIQMWSEIWHQKNKVLMHMCLRTPSGNGYTWYVRKFLVIF